MAADDELVACAPTDIQSLSERSRSLQFAVSRPRRRIRRKDDDDMQGNASAEPDHSMQQRFEQLSLHEQSEANIPSQSPEQTPDTPAAEVEHIRQEPHYEQLPGSRLPSSQGAASWQHLPHDETSVDDLYVNPMDKNTSQQVVRQQQHQQQQKQLEQNQQKVQLQRQTGTSLRSKPYRLYRGDAQPYQYMRRPADDSIPRDRQWRNMMDHGYYPYNPSGSFPPRAFPGYSRHAYYPQQYYNRAGLIPSPDLAAKLAEERHHWTTATLERRRSMRGLAVWPRSLPQGDMPAPVKFVTVNARFDDRNSLILAESSSVGVGLDTPLLELWGRLVQNREELQAFMPLVLTGIVEVSSPGRENIRKLPVRQTVGDAFMPLARCFVFVVKPAPGHEYPPLLTQDQLAVRRRAGASSVTASLDDRAPRGSPSGRHNVNFNDSANLVYPIEDCDFAFQVLMPGYGFYPMDSIS